MKLLGLSVATLVALAMPAHAGALKAHLECTPEGGGGALKAKQKIMLDHDIACSVVLDKGTLPSDAKVMIDARLSTPVGAVNGHPHEATSPDGKKFTAETFKAGGDFLPCTGVQIEGSILQGSTALWSATVSADSSCAAGKAIKGTLACTADSVAGYVSYPGNGDTLKAELPEGVTCTITAPPGDADAHFGVLAVHGSTRHAAISVMAAPSGAKAPLMFNQFIGADLPKCKSFTVDAAILDKSGAAMWQGKIAIPQVCKKKATK